MTKIMTLSGNEFDFDNPEAYHFSAWEIAAVLSKLCRFTGHTNRFYSVAEHCLAVSNLAPEGFKLEGLLHDAAEAFIGDVSTPLKAHLPAYAALEARVHKAIYRHFKLGRDEISPEVARADKEALNREMIDLMGSEPNFWLAPSDDVARSFYRRFVQLADERKKEAQA